MTSKKRGDVLAGILFLAVSLYAAVQSYRLDIGTFSSPEAGFLPLLVSALLFLTSIPLIALTPGRNEEGESQEIQGGKGGRKMLLFLLILSVLYLGLLRLTGFWIDTFLLLPVLYLLSGGKSWVRSILFSAVTIIVSYVLFTVLLKVEFPQGLILEAIPWR